MSPRQITIMIACPTPYGSPPITLISCPGTSAPSGVRYPLVRYSGASFAMKPLMPVVAASPLTLASVSRQEPLSEAAGAVSCETAGTAGAAGVIGVSATACVTASVSAAAQVRKNVFIANSQTGLRGEPGRAGRRRPGVASADHDQRIAGVDLVGLGHVNRLHGAGAGRGHRCLHLHHVHHEQFIALGDGHAL
ncbi:MAG: hypothetical protein BWX70_03005 [Verrucomicrobia bacterium ADurb.Bin070]|nr:MAG: hypothetical protein BWX70_03005 [Verrucomicrobia bacterium ADurb.Bin070]